MNQFKLSLKVQAKNFFRRLDQTPLAQNLEYADEVVGKIINRQRDLNKRSLRYQRLLAYSKSYLWYFGGAIFILSWGSFGSDMKWTSWEIYPDVYYEMLLISSEMDRRVPYAIDYKLTKGVQKGEMDALTYAALGRIYASLNYPDLSQSAFYMAHLKEHQKIGANSDLQFETTSKGSTKAAIVDDE